MAGGHTILPHTEGLLPPTGIEPTPFWKLDSKIAGLQVHATTPGIVHCLVAHKVHHQSPDEAVQMIYKL